MKCCYDWEVENRVEYDHARVDKCTHGLFHLSLLHIPATVLGFGLRLKVLGFLVLLTYSQKGERRTEC